MSIKLLSKLSSICMFVLLMAASSYSVNSSAQDCDPDLPADDPHSCDFDDSSGGDMGGGDPGGDMGGGDSGGDMGGDPGGDIGGDPSDDRSGPRI